MIAKTRDPQLINRIANSDGVREFIDRRTEPHELMDFTPACDRSTVSGVIFLTDGEDAVAAFELTGDNLYEVHTMFGKGCRGRKAVETAREMVAWMFEHGAFAIWGATPKSNAKARWFNRQVGGKRFGVDGDDELFMIARAA